MLKEYAEVMENDLHLQCNTYCRILLTRFFAG